MAPAAPPPEEEIHALVAAYKAAYESLDARAVMRIYPSVPARLENAFQALESLSMVIEPVSPPSVSGSTATAVYRVQQRIQPKVGRATETVREQTFHFQKVGSAWQITRVE